MGAKTVAGEMVTVPIEKLLGTSLSGAASRAGVSAPHGLELSQNFFTVLLYFVEQNEAPAGARA
jgi:hypothetical protein